MSGDGGYVVRRVRAEEWREVKALRMQALRDPVASIAFVDTVDLAAERPDSHWQERAARAAEGGSAAQFVAETADGDWVGSVTGLREEPGAEDLTGHLVEQLQVIVVGVWLHPDHRGRGLLRRLFDAARAWSLEQGVERVRLHVHEDNDRARAAYRAYGFRETGVRVELAAGTELEMVLGR